MTLTHISCFSGIGGMDLAAEWAGFKTMAQIEKDPYCFKILQKHWPNVPRFEDIQNVTVNSLREAGIQQQPILLSGGFPCQPFSVAGKRKGQSDYRYLWPEMFKLVQELRPSWVVGENVAGFVNMGLDISVTDLESAGYACRAFIIPAIAVGAPHRRDRVFIVAHSENERWEERGLSGRKKEAFPLSEYSSEKLADTYITGLEGYREFDKRRDYPGKWASWKGCKPFPGIWESEPVVGRVAHGVSSRVDRLRALGNGVVPQQVFPIFLAIAEIELGVT